MLDVHALGDELRAFLGHSPQQSFPAVVNKSDIIKVDNAYSLVPAAASPLPGCSQLADPRSDQAPLHDPSSFCWRLLHRDLQHVYLSCQPNGIAAPLASTLLRSSDTIKGNLVAGN